MRLVKSPYLHQPLLAAMMAVLGTLSAPSVFADESEITIVHTGDFHGHLIPRANVRSDSAGRKEGGLARIATMLKRIRDDEPNALYVHTGDTIQGGAEVLYTRGQAMIDVLNMPEFAMDAFAPGNWEFVYGTQRFIGLFGTGNANTNWGTVAANVFTTTGAGTCTNRNGPRPVAPFKIKMVDNVKVGILGLTTDRGPQVVGSSVTKGLCFLKNGDDVFVTNAVTGVVTQTVGGVDSEVAAQVAHLRDVEGVQIVILASEMGLANNIRLAEKIPGINVILSSDMHEETSDPVVAVNTLTGAKTVILEEGQDGTMMSRLKIEVKNGELHSWHVKSIRVDDKIKENKNVAAKIAAIRANFTGPDYATNVNPFNGSKLKRPIDSVVGTTAIPLHRSNFSHENMPGAIEGSSHDFLTDAFKAMSGAEIGAIRGFRYGTHVDVGAITYEDLFHFMPIGAQIGSGKLPGQAIKNQIENAADGSLNPDVSKWTGGWLFNFSGVTMDLDPYAAPTGVAPFALSNGRASNIMVNGAPLAFKKADGVTNQTYSYASYWYSADPCKLNTIDVPGCVATNGVPSNITVLKEADGSPMDGTEVVVNYLQSLGGAAVNPVLNRITLKDKATGAPTTLPAAEFGNSEVQPLRGAQR
ncbi:MAG: 5'-nucleotidase C-terminal domain-containing protein [Pseudomonadota bacterium]